MWVINIQHWLNETKSGPAGPQLKLKVKKLSEIIIYATSISAKRFFRVSQEIILQV